MPKLPASLALALLVCLPFPAGAADMIADGTFENGEDGFWASGGVVLSRHGGKLCADVEAGGEPWGRLIGVNDLEFSPGTSYRLTMTLEATGRHVFPILVQRNAEPWTAQATLNAETKAGIEAFSTVFKATEPEPAQIILHLGGVGKSWRFCLDNVAIQEATPEEIAAEVPRATRALPALVNQAGYFLDGPKRATILSGADKPLTFRLEDAAGMVVGEGLATPAGFDETVGSATQIADFSPFRTAGEGYRLIVDGKRSYPFAVGHDIYGKLRIDALSWFYPQRSGIEIDGDIAGDAYARPAGHVQKSPNRGDAEVTCLTGTVAVKLYGKDWTCDYTLDVSGGWYDAGDQGKYVVNGGIAVAQLLGTFERGLVFGKGASPVVSDSLSRIPENGNGVPDILDEARWELEFLMKMMVPDGQPLAGMVHHKVHDTKWTGVPMLPHLDPELRALHRPSTAATLNLVAAAAQGARLFAPYDEAFSKKLLAAAEKAWRAATLHPALYAPNSDGLQGGGDYGDTDVTDEFYWAAAELYISTGEARYLAALKSSPHWTGPVFPAVGAFDWRSVAGLGRLDLALYGDGLPEEDRVMIRESVVSAAGAFTDLQKNEPFGHIYRPAKNRYDWGSNQLILQNMIVVSAGYDLTGEQPFLNSVRESMDYIFGRNAMNLSYVTGYGSAFAKNQHSRWYAHQLDETLPNPPIGTLAGGPNSTLVDDVAKARLKGCRPQTCYVDDIMSWGTNELTINWNAPLVYVASFLADAR
ncbi:glycoside hydrolase family 9 protein [Pararhizobium sp. BT-229]|uniref:glycoside hydrolase family 9 protein n=1 Tax=Pararhizobium sp. BT-229 TaxID=2986923 RepID=UPI0021F7D0E5|nr:glycoside hydrolase family 9 protein [Pararhizobium sp. BT-229]MCV9961367.1 glycoside hydrolase family 9 protein [Pararhizobium sp. BT-229]